MVLTIHINACKVASPLFYGYPFCNEKVALNKGGFSLGTVHLKYGLRHCMRDGLWWEWPHNRWTTTLVSSS